jgi:hypothetical protein
VFNDREYTVSFDGEVSFRIQVALRAGMIEEGDVRAFMEGKTDGKAEQVLIDMILKRILSEKVGACEDALKDFVDSSFEGRVIRDLWESELEIARRAYERLIEEQ